MRERGIRLSGHCLIMAPSDQKQVEQLLEIAGPVLAKRDYRMVRLDELGRENGITSEAVRYIRESPLCIIILTGREPALFYWVGRRHESGMDSIHLVREGERLPFGTGDLPIIHYSDPSSPEWVKALEVALERMGR